MRRTSDEYVTLTSVQLAVLLDLPREDSVYLSVAPVRLPAEWYDAWQVRMGPRELTPAEVSLVSGLSASAVRGALRPAANPHLNHRVTGSGKNPRRLIAPAAVVQFIRDLNGQFRNKPRFSETPAQESRRGKLEQAMALAICRSDYELAERLERFGLSRSSPRYITTYLTTHRKCCPAIAESGFIERPSGPCGPGVYLLPFPTIGPAAGRSEVQYNEDIEPLDAEQVVFEFRIPNAEAKRYAHGEYEYLPRDHPNFDPERDTPDPYFPDRAPADTWVVPADVANRLCVGLKFWSGKRPFSDEQLRAIKARRKKN